MQSSEKEFGRKLTEAELYAQLVKNTEDLGISKKAQGNGMLNLSMVAHNAQNEMRGTIEASKTMVVE